MMVNVVMGLRCSYFDLGPSGLIVTRVPLEAWVQHQHAISVFAWPHRSHLAFILADADSGCTQLGIYRTACS